MTSDFEVIVCLVKQKIEIETLHNIIIIINRATCFNDIIRERDSYREYLTPVPNEQCIIKVLHRFRIQSTIIII